MPRRFFGRASPVELTHRVVRGATARLHLVEAGRGPAVLLLHGFPELWYSWRRQLTVLAERHRVIAADLPGFNESEPLGNPDAYRSDLVAAEIAEVLRRCGPAAVVGHDWGGMVAWWLAHLHPELVTKLVVVNCPHPSLDSQISLRNPAQLLRSWYVAVLRLPVAPHLARFALPLALRAIVPEREERAVYAASLRRTGLREPLHYYRHLGRADAPRCGPPRAPALLVWGERDPFLSSGLIERTRRVVPHLLVRRVPRGGHWVHQRRPDVVNEAICRFLQG